MTICMIKYILRKENIFLAIRKHGSYLKLLVYTQTICYFHIFFVFCFKNASMVHTGTYLQSLKKNRQHSGYDVIFLVLYLWFIFHFYID